MEVLDAINARHSVRSFEERAVPEDVLKELVEVAVKAPSAMNRQPWRFYVVSSKVVRDKVAELLGKYLDSERDSVDKLRPELKNTLYDFYRNLGGCQNIVFVFRKNADCGPKDVVRLNDFASISCAVENFMLAAVEKGLGTCWVGSFRDRKDEIAKLVGAEDEELVASVLVGYPSKDFVPMKRSKKELNDVLKFV